jgi:hypothetical protein
VPDLETELTGAFRDALREKTLRITFNETHLLQSGEKAVSARFEVRNERGRWTRVGPLLFGPNGGGLPDLLEVIKYLST